MAKERWSLVHVKAHERIQKKEDEIEVYRVEVRRPCPLQVKITDFAEREYEIVSGGSE